MKVFLVVHGFVQGVGYRALVKRAADKYGVKGIVRNAGNGTVEILAEAGGETLRAFEKEISVDLRNGPSVVSVERHQENEGAFPKDAHSHELFEIED